MNVRLPLFFVLFWGLGHLAQAQADSVSHWKKSLNFGINANQASFSDNWKGGGVNSIALGTLLNVKAIYDRDRMNWSNEADFQYGVVRNQGQNTRKTADRIFFDSKFGYKFRNPKWQFFGSLNFTSQFAPGYRYDKDVNNNEVEKTISLFMSPGFLTQSLGLEHKPKDYFWLRMGVATLRQTFVLDTTIYKQEPTNYGVPIGKKARHEGAFQLTANFDKEIAKNMTLKARYMTFLNYDLIDRPEQIDHRLDMNLIAKVNKYVNVNLAVIVLYDYDMDLSVQTSQLLSLGFQYAIKK